MATPYITKENAAELARRSHLPTSARYLQKPASDAPAPATGNQLDTEQQCADDFRRLRLSRVRKQLDKLDKLISDEIDPGKLDRLASAVSRLAEQERQLSNRSLPPTLKANQVKPAKSRSTATPEPVFDPGPTPTPQPIVVSPPPQTEVEL